MENCQIFGKIQIFWKSCDLTLDTWDTDYIADNWEQQYLQLLCDLWIKGDGDSIRNSCDVSDILLMLAKFFDLKQVAIIYAETCQMVLNFILASICIKKKLGRRPNSGNSCHMADIRSTPSAGFSTVPRNIDEEDGDRLVGFYWFWLASQVQEKNLFNTQYAPSETKKRGRSAASGCWLAVRQQENTQRWKKRRHPLWAAAAGRKMSQGPRYIYTTL